MLRFVAVLLLLLFDRSALASDWQGVWVSKDGTLRLVGEGRRVFGDWDDAASGVPTRIEARTSRDGRRVRGTFHGIADGRTRTWGTLDLTLTQDGSGFEGWVGRRRLADATGLRIAARRQSRARPRLKVARADVMNWPPARLLTTEPYRRFVRFQPPLPPRPKAKAAAGWQGTWRTSFGELVLRQRKVRVWGEIAERGIVVEASLDPDHSGTLRGTLYRPVTQIPARGEALWGTFVFEREGDGPFTGRWRRDGIVDDEGLGWRGARAGDGRELKLAKGRDRYWPRRWAGRPPVRVRRFLRGAPAGQAGEDATVRVLVPGPTDLAGNPSVDANAVATLPAGEQTVRCVPSIDPSLWTAATPAGRREMLRTRWCSPVGIGGFMEGSRLLLPDE